ncbi:MAG: hypothetical protein CO141_03315 [Candidatus Moranbacteria bacterium CG_4_9_14_3_um_filter_42_9]|nr:MAG: hypothetical protein CO141_03315 [Candidatus Moranbacteria bacterium CG_4_9_14_3_um_filter_42_9]
MQKKTIQAAFLLALGEVGYIFLVAMFFHTMEKYFGGQPDPPAPFGMVIILTLLVLSAAVSGALILGKPLLMYLDGKKRESVELFAFTLGWLVLFLVISIAVLAYRS